MSANDNPRTLPINLYTVGPPKVKPFDLNKLEDVPLQHSPQKDATELLYESNQIVSVNGDKGDSENSLVLAYLQQIVEVNRKKLMGKV